jgi:hypothetical protein
MLTLLALPVISEATTVERLTLDGLVKKSDSIIVGRVAESKTFWSKDHKVILTTWRLEVAETIKGQASRSMHVTTIGGTIGNLTLHVAGMPVFEEGEDAVVFVEHLGEFSTVVGLGQGKFAVKNDEVANTPSGLEFSDGRGPGALRMRLQSFKNEIKDILASRP